MNDRMFRNAMGTFATGVTIITTEYDNEEYGMTANAFMSVSMDPKLVVISIDKNANMLENIKKSNKYAINILAENQQDISMHFAGQKKSENIPAFNTLSDVPVVEGALVQVTCEVIGEHVEGDHTLFIGKVTGLHLEEGNPLIFYKGQYQSLQREKVSI